MSHRAVAAVTAVGLAIVTAGCGKTTYRAAPAGAVSPTSTTTKATADRFFADSDPMNRANVHHQATNSAAMISQLLSGDPSTVAVGDYAVPIYRATSSTPTFTVTPRDHVGDWGPNPFKGYRFPWDPSWSVPAGTDGWAAVITADGTSLECWRTRVSGGKPSCEWGAVTDSKGSSVSIAGAPTGSGLSRLAGVITQADWDSGTIDHALTFGTPYNDQKFVYPAVKTDGDESGLWSEGEYIWLDPSYDIDADTSLLPYERMVAHALQDHGAFDVDNAEAWGFMSEFHAKIPGNTSTNWAGLSHIKFAKYLHAGTIDRAS